jgi:hypothetical protein
MDEILPGIHHWTAFRDTIGMRVHSYYVEPARALIDPLVPEEGLEAFDGLAAPERVLLTNRHHFRHSDRFREAFGCEVLASAPGMHDLEGRGVTPFEFGEEVAPGVTAVEIGVICPDETALHVADAGAVAFADGLIREGGTLGFVPDVLLGDEPERVRAGLAERFRALAREREFDALLFAHGEPLPRGGKAALRGFVDGL